MRGEGEGEEGRDGGWEEGRERGEGEGEGEREREREERQKERRIHGETVKKTERYVQDRDLDPSCVSVLGLLMLPLPLPFLSFFVLSVSAV